MCIILQNAFAEFKTEHQTLQYFRQRGYRIMPQSLDIGTLDIVTTKMYTNV